jgi:hypothetical protein
MSEKKETKDWIQKETGFIEGKALNGHIFFIKT